VELSIVRIGNSRGLRLPKEILDRLGFSDKVEVVLGENSLTLYAVKKPRDGWSETAKAMHEAGDDALMIPDVLDDDPVQDISW
jgi:antitoxin MazE